MKRSVEVEKKERKIKKAKTMAGYMIDSEKDACCFNQLDLCGCVDKEEILVGCDGVCGRYFHLSCEMRLCNDNGVPDGFCPFCFMEV